LITYGIQKQLDQLFDQIIEMDVLVARTVDNAFRIKRFTHRALEHQAGDTRIDLSDPVLWGQFAEADLDKIGETFRESKNCRAAAAPSNTLCISMRR
jgi:hypothetical protein